MHIKDLSGIAAALDLGAYCREKKLMRSLGLLKPALCSRPTAMRVLAHSVASTSSNASTRIKRQVSRSAKRLAPSGKSHANVDLCVVARRQLRTACLDKIHEGLIAGSSMLASICSPKTQQ